jgi:serine/threonine protein kinase
MSDRERHVNRILAEALKLPAGERFAYAEEQCGPDRDLYLEVASLLRHHHTADKSFELPELPVSENEQRSVDRLRLERFEVGELISEGGMGKVFEGRQISPERRVAIKVLSPELSSNTKAAEYFVREAAVLAKLDHHSIVKVIESGECDGTLFMVMEYVAGEDGGPPVTLRDVLDRGALEPGRVRAIMLDITSALGFAHKQGCVHRDIKPSNILIDRHGKARILDFGIASVDLASRKLTTGNMVMGTLDYMSPEQKTNTGVVGGQSDVFSLGVVLYEMLTGKLPLGAFEPPSVCRPELGTTWDGVVHKALESQCERRFRSMEEFRRALPSLKSAPVLSSEHAAQAVRGPGSGSAEVAVLEGHTGLVTTLAFTADSQSVVSGGRDKCVRMWNLLTGERIDWEGHTEKINCVAADPLGRWCASGSDDHTVRLWPMDGKAGGFVLKEHRAPVVSVAFHPKGVKLVSCSLDSYHTVVPFEANFFRQFCLAVKYFFRADNRVKIWDIRKWCFDSDIQASSENANRFLAGDGEKRWEIWGDEVVSDWLTHRWRLARGIPFVRSVEFLPNSYLATNHGVGWIVWQLPSYLVERFLGKRDDRRPQSIRISPDCHQGLFIRCENMGSTVTVDELGGMQEKQRFLGETHVEGADVTSDWSRMVSCGGDGTVRVWDMRDGRQLDEFRFPDVPRVVRVSPDNRFCAAGGGDVHNESAEFKVRVWNMPP